MSTLLRFWLVSLTPKKSEITPFHVKFFSGDRSEGKISSIPSTLPLMEHHRDIYISGVATSLITLCGTRHPGGDRWLQNCKVSEAVLECNPSGESGNVVAAEAEQEVKDARDNEAKSF